MYRFGAALIVSATVAATTLPAIAQPVGDCSCLLSATQAAGQIDSTTGQVLVSGQGGFVLAEDGTPLLLGSQIITGDASEALVNLGSGCLLRIGAGLNMTIVPQGEQACVRVTRAQPNPPSEDVAKTGGNGPNPYVVVGGGGALAVGIGLLAASK